MGKLKSLMRNKRIAIVLMSFLFLAGCQSINGVDLSTVLVKQIVSESVEGSLDVTVHMVPEQTVETDPNTLDMINALNNMQIILENFKQQDWNTMSAKGKLVISRGDIPFQLVMSRTSLVIQIEGASVPIMIPLDSATNPLSSLTGIGESDTLATEAIQEKAITESLVSLIVKHLANPTNISVQNVTETINGQSLSLFKIHSDIKGPEILSLLKKSLRSLVMDDAGMKLVINQLYDVMKAVATEEDDNLYGLGLGFGASDSTDQELEIEFIHTFVKQALLMFLMMLDDEAAVSEVDPFLNDNTYMRSDLYVDSSLHIRKADFELSIAPEFVDQADLEGISSVQIEGHGLFWNHNKSVTADTFSYDDADGFYIDDLTSSGDEFMSIMDQESVLYKLMQDLNATQRTATFSTNGPINYDEDDYEYDNMSYAQAIMNNGIMAIPARSLADNLGLHLLWNDATRELTLTSPSDGLTISFTINSDKATVNGTVETMPLATFINNGLTYIPLRFVADTIGAVIEWDHETQTATVIIN